MDKTAFLSEMLEEVKNLKDLAKGEMPEVAKEYILANKINNILSLTLGLLLFITSVFALHFTVYSESTGNLGFGVGMVGSCVGLLGFLIISCSISSLIDLYFQPRRMAIKAVTSLLTNEN